MRNVVLTTLVFLVGIIGLILSLIQIYASPDGLSYPLNGSIVHIGSSIFILAFCYNIDNFTSTIIKWITTVFIAIYSIFGFLLALICLYALENGQTEPLASALFVTSSMVVASGVFFIIKNTSSLNNEQNRMNQNNIEMTDENMQYANFFTRLAAVIIDVLLIFIISFLLNFILLVILKIEVPKNLVGIFGEVIGAFILWLYYAVSHSSNWQASIGKKILGLKVVDYQGNKISFLRASGRILGWYISAMLFGIGHIVALWTNKKQAFHDFLAKTLVVKVSNHKSHI